MDEAERLLRVALTNDPLSRDARRELASVLIQAGRYQEAIDNIQAVRPSAERTPDRRLDRDRLEP